MNKFSIVSDLLAQINSQLHIPEQEMELFYPLLLSELSEGEQIYFENVGTFFSTTNESGVQSLSFVPDGMTDELRTVDINLFPEHDNDSDNLLDQTITNETNTEILAKEFAAIMETGYRSFPVDIVNEEKIVEKIATVAETLPKENEQKGTNTDVKIQAEIAAPLQNVLPWHLSSEWSLGVDAPVSLDDDMSVQFGGLSEREVFSEVTPGKKIIKKEYSSSPRAVESSSDSGFTPVLLPGEVNSGTSQPGIQPGLENFDPMKYDVPNASIFGSHESNFASDSFAVPSNSFDDFAVDGVGQNDDEFGFANTSDTQLPFENSFEPDFSSAAENEPMDFDSLIMDPSVNASTDSSRTFIAPEPEEPIEKIGLPATEHTHTISKQELRSFKIGAAFTEEPAPLIEDVGIAKRSASFGEIIAHFLGSLFKKKAKDSNPENVIPELNADKLAIDVSAKNASPIMPEVGGKTFFAPPVDDEFAKPNSEKMESVETPTVKDGDSPEKEVTRSFVPLYAAAIILVGLIGVLGYAQLFMGGVLALLHGNQTHESEQVQVATIFRDFSFPVSAQYPPLAQMNTEAPKSEKKTADKMDISDIIENEKKNQEQGANSDSMTTTVPESKEKLAETTQKPKTTEHKSLEGFLGIKEKPVTKEESKPEKKPETKPAVKQTEKKAEHSTQTTKPTEKKPAEKKPVVKEPQPKNTVKKSTETPEVKKTEYKKPVTGDIYESGGKYYVQHSSWASEGKATESWRELRAKGLKVIVEKTTVPEKGERYRVRSGPYGSLEEARQAEQKLK